MSREQEPILVHPLTPTRTDGMQSYVVQYQVGEDAPSAVFDLIDNGNGNYMVRARVDNAIEAGSMRLSGPEYFATLRTIGEHADIDMFRRSAETVAGEAALVRNVTARASAQVDPAKGINDIARIGAALIVTPLTRESGQTPETFEVRLGETLRRTRFRMQPPPPRI